METTKWVRLGDVAVIRSGYPFRSKVKHTPEAWDYYVLQLRAVQKDRLLDLSQADQVRIPDQQPPQALRRGDVLLRARGGYFHAALFDLDAANVVAAGQFLILAPQGWNLDPAYLGWWLNEPQAQSHLDKGQSGTNMPMITKRLVSDLEIPLPSLAIQRKVAAIHQCWLQEKHLTEQLLGNREQMVRGICQQFINGNNQ